MARTYPNAWWFMYSSVCAPFFGAARQVAHEASYASLGIGNAPSQLRQMGEPSGSPQVVAIPQTQNITLLEEKIKKFNMAAAPIRQRADIALERAKGFRSSGNNAEALRLMKLYKVDSMKLTLYDGAVGQLRQIKESLELQAVSRDMADTLSTVTSQMNSDPNPTEGVERLQRTIAELEQRIVEGADLSKVLQSGFASAAGQQNFNDNDLLAELDGQIASPLPKPATVANRTTASTVVPTTTRQQASNDANVLANLLAETSV